MVNILIEAELKDVCKPLVYNDSEYFWLKGGDKCSNNTDSVNASVSPKLGTTREIHSLSHNYRFLPRHWSEMVFLTINLLCLLSYYRYEIRALCIC